MLNNFLQSLLAHCFWFAANELHGSVTLLSSSWFPAAAISCFHKPNSEKLAVHYLPSHNTAEKKVSNKLPQSAEHLRLKNRIYLRSLRTVEARFTLIMSTIPVGWSCCVFWWVSRCLFANTSAMTALCWSPSAPCGQKSINTALIVFTMLSLDYK